MDSILKYAQDLPDINIMGVYGALKTKSTQAKELEKGVDVLVSTPGRLITLIKDRKVQNLPKKKKKEVVKDVFNEYMGFAEKKGQVEEDEDEDEYREVEHEQDEVEDVEEDVEEVGEDVGEDVSEDASDSTVKYSIVPGGVIDFSQTSILVLDEVDRMLDMGHMSDIKNLFFNLPLLKSKDPLQQLQILMFTATLMPKILNLVSRFSPHNERIDLNWDMKMPTELKSVMYSVSPRRKHALIAYLLRRKGPLKGKKVLVFSRSSQRVKNLAALLKADGFNPLSIHRKQTLSERQRTIDAFRSNKSQILVSTELMARGIDIPDLQVAINYDVPHVPEEYIHRVGRVGRNGNEGYAVTLVANEVQTVSIGQAVAQIDEEAYIKSIEALLGKKIPTSKVPGPWRDGEKPKSEWKKEADEEKEGIEVEKKVDPVERKTVETVERLKAKSGRILDQAMKRKRGLKYANKKEKEAAQVVRKKNPGLRDFQEGRYEDVITKLEIKRLREAGTKVPENYVDKRTELEKKKEKERELKRQGITPNRPSRPKDGKFRYQRRAEERLNRSLSKE